MMQGAVSQLYSIYSTFLASSYSWSNKYRSTCIYQFVLHRDNTVVVLCSTGVAVQFYVTHDCCMPSQIYLYFKHFKFLFTFKELRLAGFLLSPMLKSSLFVKVNPHRLFVNIKKGVVCLWTANFFIKISYDAIVSLKTSI